MPKTLLAGALLSCSLTGAAILTAGPAEGASAAKSVRIKNIDFSPHTLTVKRGATVTWTFEDAATPHNVTSRGHQKFKSSPTKQSGSYSVRFTKPGTYNYVCTIHFNMKAKIVVK